MSKRLFATIILMVALFMDMMDSTITNIALPAIGNDLAASPAQLEWTIVGYVIAFATLLTTGGRLGDIFGRRRIFVIGVIGFTGASLIASFSLTGDFLVCSRIIQGVFAGIMVPQVLSIVQVMFLPHERGPIFGIIGAMSALGATGGLLIGGWLVTINAFSAGWRSIFLINVPVGLLLAVAALIFVPNSRSGHPLKLDVVGVLLGASTVFLVVFPLTDGRQAGWSWWIWTMLAAAPFALAAFVMQQKHKLAADGSALLPMTLFRNHGFASGSLVQVLSSVGNGSYALVLIFYVQQALGFTPLSAGLTILPLAIGSMVATAVAIPLAQALGKYAVVLGGLIQAGAFVWVMASITAAGSALTGWDLVLPLGLAGVGMMILIMPQMNLTLATVPTADAGAASGSLTTLGQTGMVIGVALAGSLYFGRLADGASAQDGVVTGLVITVGAFLIAAAAGLWMPKRSATVSAADALESTETEAVPTLG